MQILFGCTTPSIIATQSIQKGDQFNNSNNYNEAIIHYEKYLELSPQLGVYRNLSQEAEVHRRLAYAYSTQGKYQVADKHLHSAIKIDESFENNSIERSEDYRMLGMNKAYLGKMNEGISWLTKSLEETNGLETSIKEERRLSVARTSLSLSQINLSLGNYLEALHYAKQAESLYLKSKKALADLAEVYLIQGIISRDQGKLNLAEEKIESSKLILESLNLNTGRTFQALAELFIQKGDLENGVRNHLKAVEEALSSNIKPQIIIAYMRLGDVYNRLNDKENAEQYYIKALEYSESTDLTNDSFQSFNSKNSDLVASFTYYQNAGSALGMALVQLRVGQLDYEKGDFENALVNFSKALTLFEKTGNTEGIAKSNLDIGKTYIKLENYLDAKEHLNEAISTTNQRDLLWKILFEEAEIFRLETSYELALKKYEESVSVINEMRANYTVEEFKTLFANSKVKVYDQLITLLIENKNSWSSFSSFEAEKMAFEYSEQARSRTFLDLLGNKKVSPKSDEDSTLLSQEQLLRLKISQLVKKTHTAESNGELREVSKELFETQKIHENLLQEIKLRSPSYSTVLNIMPPEVSKIQEKIKDDNVLIEYWLGENALIIFTISQNSLNTKIIKIKKSEIEKQVRGIRNIIQLNLGNENNLPFQKLYSVLIEPIYNEIKNYEKLTIVPQGALHFLPFQVLYNENKRFLVQDFVINSSPSASVYHLNSEDHLNNDLDLYGVALGDLKIGNYNPLPGTELEVKQLSKIYSNFDQIIGKGVYEDVVKSNISNYNYVHLATHGVFNSQQPLYSYLLLEPSEKDDGRLTVDEIYDLNIKSNLVTLSACETGLGELHDGDDLVGLSRAFLYAGAKNVVVSLWKVDDATTSWLMTRFYQYIKGGNSTAQALTYAQRDLLKKNLNPGESRGVITDIEIHPYIINSVKEKSSQTIRKPYYWAPFIVIGNGQ